MGHTSVSRQIDNGWQTADGWSITPKWVHKPKNDRDVFEVLVGVYDSEITKRLR
jgi:hypothetical protein